MSKTILLVGPGALGTFYGALLQESGYVIDVCVRDKTHYELTWELTSAKKKTIFKPNLFWNLDELSENKKSYTAILVCTKVLEQDTLIDQLLQFEHIKTTPILLMQNGYGIEASWIQRGLGHHLARALGFICVYRKSVKEVLHLDYGDVVVGTLENSLPTWLSELCSAWQAQGIDAVHSETLIEAIWQKQLWNVPFSSCSALYGLSTKDMLVNHTIKKHISEMMKEVCLVAKLDGVIIENTFCDFMIEQTKKMIDYKSSMLLDLEAKRPMELDCILGSVIKKANKNNVVIPAILDVYQQLLNIKSTI